MNSLSSNRNTKPSMLFNYRALRLIMGIIAFALPILVYVFSSTSLSSISASYYTEARDYFVGSLVSIATLLFAYKGRSQQDEKISEAILSRVACILTLLVVIFPTSCDVCASNWRTIIHYFAAGLLFGILAYFCLGPFSRQAQKKIDETNRTESFKIKAKRRKNFYLICGVGIIIFISATVISNFALPKELLIQYRITFWGELAVLWLFSFAWLVASQYKLLTVFVEKSEALDGILD